MSPTTNQQQAACTVYLDNCCLNRPFDDQQSIKVRLETEAKLYIQQQFLGNRLRLVWSYILDYENVANPYSERRHAIAVWRRHAVQDVEPTRELLAYAKSVQSIGVKPKDALHLACAASAGCDYFITTDKGILKKARQITDVQVVNPVDCIECLEHE